MDPEDLRSELLALRRLYALLINDARYVEYANSANLDNNARRLLINLLDAEANKAFDAHAKILGTQSGTSYSLRSIPHEQSRNRLSLRPHPTYAPVDLITGQGIFTDPTNQAVFSAQPQSIPRNESNARLKRCRVCQKPNIKRFTREVSIGNSKVLTFYNRSQNQNHKRSWEVLNDLSRVGDVACSSNNPFTVDFSNSLALTNLTDQADQISREACTKIMQIESCISSLQVAARHFVFFKSDFEHESSQSGNFSAGRSDPNSSITRTLKPRDMAHHWHDQTARPIDELTLQSQPFSMSPMIMMLPAGQTVSQQAEKVGQRNQHGHMPEEAYNPFHSEVSSNLNKRVDNNRPLDSKINRERLDRMQILQWRIPPDGYTVGSSDRNELQESETARQKNTGKTCKDKDHINDHRRIQGTHELVDPKKMHSPKSKWLSDSSVSSLNDSSSQSQSQSQSHHGSASFSDNKSERELQSRSSISRDHEESESESDSESESEKDSVSSRDQSPYMKSSKESTGSISKKMGHTKDHKKGKQKEPKKKSKSKMNSVSSQDQSPSMSGSFESSGSISKKTGHTKGHKKGKQKEPKSKSKSKSNSVSSQDQSPSMSSSFESSGSISKTAPTKGNKKGNQKEPMRNRVGLSRKLKDKLSVIFHHHHHHNGDDGHNHKGSLWKHAKKVISHKGRKKDEACAEQAVKKIQTKAAVVSKAGNKNQKRHLQALVGGLLGKSHPSKTSKEKHGGKKTGKKMQWWKMLQHQRKIKRLENLSGKINLRSINRQLHKKQQDSKKHQVAKYAASTDRATG